PSSVGGESRPRRKNVSGSRQSRVAISSAGARREARPARREKLAVPRRAERAAAFGRFRAEPGEGLFADHGGRRNASQRLWHAVGERANCKRRPAGCRLGRPLAIAWVVLDRGAAFGRREARL